MSSMRTWAPRQRQAQTAQKPAPSPESGGLPRIRAGAQVPRDAFERACEKRRQSSLFCASMSIGFAPANCGPSAEHCPEKQAREEELSQQEISCPLAQNSEAIHFRAARSCHVASVHQIKSFLKLPNRSRLYSRPRVTSQQVSCDQRPPLRPRRLCVSKTVAAHLTAPFNRARLRILNRSIG